MGAELTTDERNKLVIDLDKLPVGGELGFERDGHRFVIVKTRYDGVHTARARYFVACDTCQRLEHHATTGPTERVEQHLSVAERTNNVDPRLVDAYEIGQLRAKLEELQTRADAPIPMRLNCPSCGELHVDVAMAEKPHHTHACQHCGMVWRPAIVKTVGVHFLPGFKDS